MLVDDLVWDAALKLAKTVRDHEEALMDKYSEPWNMDILFMMHNFYALLEMVPKEGNESS